MEIKKLIEAFELAIPTYQKAVDEKWKYDLLASNKIHWGLCYLFSKSLNINIGDIFLVYYKNYLLPNRYLFEDPHPKLSTKENINKCIKPRLDFMKSEVKDLKRLLKQGYTYI